MIAYRSCFSSFCNVIVIIVSSILSAVGSSDAACISLIVKYVDSYLAERRRH